MSIFFHKKTESSTNPDYSEIYSEETPLSPETKNEIDALFRKYLDEIQELKGSVNGLIKNTFNKFEFMYEGQKQTIYNHLYTQFIEKKRTFTYYKNGQYTDTELENNNFEFDEDVYKIIKKLLNVFLKEIKKDHKIKLNSELIDIISMKVDDTNIFDEIYGRKKPFPPKNPSPKESSRNTIYLSKAFNPLSNNRNKSLVKPSNLVKKTGNQGTLGGRKSRKTRKNKKTRKSRK